MCDQIYMVHVLAYAVVLNFSLKICDVNVEIGKWNCKNENVPHLNNINYQYAGQVDVTFYWKLM